MKKIIIAIDGYSACGKSTTAREVARHLGYVYGDSGAMYRAVTYYLLQNKVPLDDPQALQQALEQINLSFKRDEEGNLQTWLNGENVEAAIRSMAVSERVSTVAAIPAVRRAMVKIQRKLGENKGLVMDGRDIGTVVFPEAELKVFMTAKPEIRAQRRLKELQAKGINATLEEVMANLAERDHKDTTRADSPLKKAADAIEIDNSFMTFEEQVEKIISLAKERMQE